MTTFNVRTEDHDCSIGAYCIEYIKLLQFNLRSQTLALNVEPYTKNTVCTSSIYTDYYEDKCCKFDCHKAFDNSTLNQLQG